MDTKFVLKELPSGCDGIEGVSLSPLLIEGSLKNIAIYNNSHIFMINDAAALVFIVDATTLLLIKSFALKGVAQRTILNICVDTFNEFLFICTSTRLLYISVQDALNQEQPDCVEIDVSAFITASEKLSGAITVDSSGELVFLGLYDKDADSYTVCKIDYRGDICNYLTVKEEHTRQRIASLFYVDHTDELLLFTENGQVLFFNPKGQVSKSQSYGGTTIYMVVFDAHVNRFFASTANGKELHSFTYMKGSIGLPSKTTTSKPCTIPSPICVSSEHKRVYMFDNGSGFRHFTYDRHVHFDAVSPSSSSSSLLVYSSTSGVAAEADTLAEVLRTKPCEDDVPLLDLFKESAESLYQTLSFLGSPDDTTQREDSPSFDDDNSSMVEYDEYVRYLLGPSDESGQATTKAADDEEGVFTYFIPECEVSLSVSMPSKKKRGISSISGGEADCCTKPSKSMRDTFFDSVWKPLACNILN